MSPAQRGSERCWEAECLVSLAGPACRCNQYESKAAAPALVTEGCR